MVKVKHKNHEYILDTERKMLMKIHDEIAIHTEDFILISKKGEKIIDIAWKTPEKIVEYFGRNTYIVLEKNYSYTEVYWLHKGYDIPAPFVQWRGIQFFSAAPEDPFMEGVYIHPTKDYTITIHHTPDGYRAKITDGKTFINIGKAGKEILLNEEYVKRILKGLKKLTEKNGWQPVPDTHENVAGRADFFLDFVREGKTCPFTPLTINSGTAKIKVATPSGVTELKVPATRIEDLTENPTSRKHRVKYPLEIPEVRKIYLNRNRIVYALKNGEEIAYSPRTHRFYVKSKRYPIHEMKTALKEAGVIP